MLHIQRVETARDTMLHVRYTLGGDDSLHDSPCDSLRESLCDSLRASMLSLAACVAKAHGIDKLCMYGSSDNSVRVNVLSPNEVVVVSVEDVPRVGVHDIHSHVRWKLPPEHARLLRFADVSDVQLLQSTLSDHSVVRARILNATRRSCAQYRGVSLVEACRS